MSVIQYSHVNLRCTVIAGNGCTYCQPFPTPKNWIDRTLCSLLVPRRGNEEMSWSSIKQIVLGRRMHCMHLFRTICSKNELVSHPLTNDRLPTTNTVGLSKTSIVVVYFYRHAVTPKGSMVTCSPLLFHQFLLLIVVCMVSTACATYTALFQAIIVSVIAPERVVATNTSCRNSAKKGLTVLFHAILKYSVKTSRSFFIEWISYSRSS